MPYNTPMNDKKKALLAYKEKILEEIQYYDKRFDEFPTIHRNNCYYDDSDSSDSEDYFPNNINTGPDVKQLKVQQAMLKTCLQATQELTSLAVLQSEINVLVQDPELNGESPVTETGTWKEVTAECKIDLVPFTITFFMHTPDRKFAPTSYRGLQVSLVKTFHEVELNNSVLHKLTRPGDAIEVIRSYAAGYRSRRTTLARLANKYTSALFMEPHPEGGFVLKCANLLEILWRLENKWSPVAPFHHRMKFDLEYMDESYIKIITQAHKQLLDPTIQTDERSLLLAKIINICLQAKGPVDSESDVESRQTDMRTETESKDKDSEVMAPPKSLPKKTKKTAVKDKDGTKDLPKDNSAPPKRSAEDENDRGNTKKVKTGEDDNSGVKIIFKAKEKSGQQKNGDTSKKDKNINVDTEVNKKKHNENVDMIKKAKNNVKNQQINKNNNQHDHVDVVSVVTNDENINENNKTEPNKNITKKNNNNDNVSEMTKTNKNDNKELRRIKSNEEIKRKNVPTCDVNNENRKTIAKKRKNNDNGPEITQANKNENKELKKVKSNEEIRRKNVETVGSYPKKSKSSSDINKPDKNLVENNKKSESGPNTINSIIGDIGSKKQDKNNVIENKESEIIVAKTNIVKEKRKNVNSDDVPPKKLDRKIKMSIANDKKFDQITKKVFSVNENKDANKKSKNVEKKQINNVATTKDTNENKKMEVVANNKAAELQKEQNKEKSNYVEPQKIVNKPNQIRTVPSKKSANENKKTEVVANKRSAEPQTKEKKTVAIPKNVVPQNNAEIPELTAAVQNKNPGNTKGLQTVKTVTEKNANIKNKANITTVNTCIEKTNKDKLRVNSNKPEKIVSGSHMLENNIINKKLSKITTQSIRSITHISPKHQNFLKVQNSPKTITTKISNGKTQVLSGNSEKENGGKISKIPQKKISLNSETSSIRSNMLRISPRRLPSKFKTISQDINSKNFTKSTNIPRLKKTFPKT